MFKWFCLLNFGYPASRIERPMSACRFGQGPVFRGSDWPARPPGVTRSVQHRLCRKIYILYRKSSFLYRKSIFFIENLPFFLEKLYCCMENLHFYIENLHFYIEKLFLHRKSTFLYRKSTFYKEKLPAENYERRKIRTVWKLWPSEYYFPTVISFSDGHNFRTIREIFRRSLFSDDQGKFADGHYVPMVIISFRNSYGNPRKGSLLELTLQEVTLLVPSRSSPFSSQQGKKT